jgi:hypothetical protein
VIFILLQKIKHRFRGSFLNFDYIEKPAWLMNHEFIDNGGIPNAVIQIWILMAKFPAQSFYPG